MKKCWSKCLIILQQGKNKSRRGQVYNSTGTAQSWSSQNIPKQNHHERYKSERLKNFIVTEMFLVVDFWNILWALELPSSVVDLLSPQTNKCLKRQWSKSNYLQSITNNGSFGTQNYSRH